MSNLNIVIPILNEVIALPKLINQLQAYPVQIPITFIDAGSSDGSYEYLKKNKHSLNATIIREQVKSPSILKTLALIETINLNEEYCFIHSVDIDATMVISFLDKNFPLKNDYYICYKRYDDDHLLLTIQEWVLNNIRVSLLKQFVWTNAPIVKTTKLKKLSKNPSGFLEDIIASDDLRSCLTPSIIKTPVIVSGRRYIKDGVSNRLFGNILIMIMYRFKLKTIAQLKAIYYN